MTTHGKRCWLALGSLMLCGGALAQDAATLRVRSLAATCANCHGSEGRAVSGAAVPGLAGMPADYLAAQMQAFRSGARSATVMHQIARGYSETQVTQLAAYFSAQSVSMQAK